MLPNIKNLQLIKNADSLETAKTQITNPHSDSKRVELYSLLEGPLAIQILSRIVQYGEKLDPINCLNLLNLSATNKDIKRIVNEYLKVSVEIHLKTQLTQNVFPYSSLDFYEIMSVYNHYNENIFLFLLSMHFSSHSEICKQFQDSKHALNLIKMLTMGNLDIPDNEMQGLSIKCKKLFEKIVKNSILGSFDPLLDKRTYLSFECIHWIIMNSLGCLNENDHQKIEKALQVFILLFENAIITENSEYSALIFKKIINCLNKDLSSINHNICLKLLLEIAKKEIITNLFPFLEAWHMNQPTAWGINFFEIFAQKNTLLVQSKFTEMLIEENIDLLNTDNAHFAGTRLTILSENGILIRYPQYLEMLTERAIDWFLKEEGSASSIDLINSLLENYLFFSNDKNYRKILKKVFNLLDSDNHVSNVDYHSIFRTVSFINELAKYNPELSEISDLINEQNLSELDYRLLNEFTDANLDLWQINNEFGEKDLSTTIPEFFLDNSLVHALGIFVFIIAILLRAILSNDNLFNFFINR